MNLLKYYLERYPKNIQQFKTHLKARKYFRSVQKDSHTLCMMSLQGPNIDHSHKRLNKKTAQTLVVGVNIKTVLCKVFQQACNGALTFYQLQLNKTIINISLLVQNQALYLNYMSFNQSGFLTIQKRCLFMQVNIFKVKRIAENSVLFHLPNKKCILSVDTKLQNRNKIFHFQDYPQSIQYCPKGGIDYVFAGCINGVIQAQQYQYGKQQFKLGVKGQLQDQQNYINDLKYLGRGRLANCYNNGTIAIWDIEKQEQVIKMRQVHKRFTYKLRTFDQRLFSCGNDGCVVVTDLEQCEPISVLKHQQAVWCANPWSYNELVTVGLFGQVKLWDLRCNRVVQFCRLLGVQSSFVTKFNQNQVILGDQQMLVKCDLRRFQRQEVANSPMVLSAEGIEVLEDGAIVCGRGFEVCRFSNSEQMSEYSQGQVVWNPFGLMTQSQSINQIQVQLMQAQNDQLQPEQEDFIQAHLALQAEQQYQDQEIAFNQQPSLSQSYSSNQYHRLNEQNKDESQYMQEQHEDASKVESIELKQQQLIEEQQQQEQINKDLPQQQQDWHQQQQES